jgi:glycosyltransferase involved in cell wall biosynthesis
MTNDQQSITRAGEVAPGRGAAAAGSPAGGGARRRVVWLHTQPEFYFNRMLDDLAAGTGYAVPGMQNVGAAATSYEWIAGFSYRGHGWYKENAMPKTAKTFFLTPLKEKESASPTIFGKYHGAWREELFGLKPDVVIGSGSGWRTHREILADCARRGVPVAMWSDSNLRSQRGRGFKSRLKRRLKKAWLGRLMRDTDVQLTANRMGVAYWRYFGVPRDRIVVSPCYSDYQRIEAVRAGGAGGAGAGEARAEVLGRIGLKPEDRVLFSAARLVRAKGLDLMVQAFVQAGLAEKGWKYVVAGVGEMEAELNALAGEALGKSIFFIGFQQPSDNLALMAHADMSVLPSRYEPHGIVVAESMAAGTPLLTSDVVGAAPDLVEEGVSGLFFRSENVGDLAAKLTWIADHPEAVRAMRAGARQVFEAWYRRTSPILVVPRVVERMLAEKTVHGGTR